MKPGAWYQTLWTCPSYWKEFYVVVSHRRQIPTFALKPWMMLIKVIHLQEKPRRDCARHLGLGFAELCVDVAYGQLQGVIILHNCIQLLVAYM